LSQQQQQQQQQQQRQRQRQQRQQQQEEEEEQQHDEHEHEDKFRKTRELLATPPTARYLYLLVNPTKTSMLLVEKFPF